MYRPLPGGEGLLPAPTLSPPEGPWKHRGPLEVGAVTSGEQRVGPTVQGTGRDPVVLEALHARVITEGAPPAWNDWP